MQTKATVEIEKRTHGGLISIKLPSGQYFKINYSDIESFIAISSIEGNILIKPISGNGVKISSE